MNVNINTSGPGRNRSSAISGSAAQSSTATGKEATGKLGKIAGKVGTIAAKYGQLIPGVGGIVSTIGKLVSGNDPEWWQHVPGTGVSTNVPLSAQLSEAKISLINTTEQNRLNLVTMKADTERPSILEIQHALTYSRSSSEDPVVLSRFPIINPSEAMVSTYLMQEIRKVLNAVPLQSVGVYRDILANSVAAYSIKKTLDKWIDLTKESKPFIPALTDGSFPTLTAANYATLVAARDTLAEYIKASVKLPHTLCQYLTWRFGRIFRMNASAKAGIVLYDAIPLAINIGALTDIVNRIVGFAADPYSYFEAGEVYGDDNPKAKALADMYNAYIDHVIDVPIDPSTHFMYDAKEFVLRTNLDASVGVAVDEEQDTEIGVSGSDYVYMDSSLDNVTTFMASTVSTQVANSCLFPVSYFTFYYVSNANFTDLFTYADSASGEDMRVYRPSATVGRTAGAYCYLTGYSGISVMRNNAQTDGVPNARNIMYLVLLAAFCKAADFYNAEIYFPLYSAEPNRLPWQLDLTAMSTDLALVPTPVLANTHMYAFANLVYVGVKNFAAKEKAELAKEATAALSDIKAATAPGPDKLPSALTVAQSME